LPTKPAKPNKEQKDEWIWWKHGVIYHIYPRSFYDANGDGVGDLEGIIQKLDYLSELGVTAIWLSPIYDSPNHDFGYDVKDYRKIHPSFGTLDDFKKLLKKAHKKGIRIIMDLIMNHTSIYHPWFIESSSSRSNPKRDWYIWKDAKNGKAPNNWKSAFIGSAWEWHEDTGQYYMHSFLKEQADLNWRNEDMQMAFFEEIQYWLDLGVDGFRLDVINLIIKDKKFRDNPQVFRFINRQVQLYTRNRPASYKIVRKFRKLLDSYNDKMSVGEIYSTPPGNPAIAASYLGKGEDALHLTFDFSLIFRRWSARSYYLAIRRWMNFIPKKGWPCFVLSNHDLHRSINRIGIGGNKNEKAKIAATLLLTMKGTPFIYYGEEIGIPNVKIDRKDIKDPLGKRYWPIYSGRDSARTPMRWTDGENAGFSTANPWLPVGDDFPENNVQVLEKDPESIFNVYKRLITLRNENEILQKGNWLPFLKGQKGVLAYYRDFKKERILVALNFTAKSKWIYANNGSIWKVLFSTHRDENDFLCRKTELEPYEALVLYRVPKKKVRKL
jgi:alpha-glucosidase